MRNVNRVTKNLWGVEIFKFPIRTSTKAGDCPAPTEVHCLKLKAIQRGKSLQPRKNLHMRRVTFVIQVGKSRNDEDAHDGEERRCGVWLGHGL